MSCDAGEVTERLENELCSDFPSLHLRHSAFSNPSVALPTSQIILQPFRCFAYVIAHSPTLLSLLQPFRHFTYVTVHSPTLPSLYLRHRSFFKPSVASLTHSSFSNPSFASTTSQALHLRHPASRPCPRIKKKIC